MIELLARIGMFFVLLFALLWLIDRWFGPDERENHENVPEDPGGPVLGVRAPGNGRSDRRS